jgi:hypothetical protein
MANLNIVVAYYDKPNFIDLVNMFSGANIFIYDKSPNSNSKKFKNLSGVNTHTIIPTENVGREGETYFKYILENYDALPEYSVFLQDDTHHHLLDYKEFVATTYQKIEQGVTMYQYPCTWNSAGPIYSRDVIHGFVELSKLGVEGGDDYTIQKITRRMGIPLPPIYKTETCAFFLVRRDLIRRWPKEFYAALREWLLTDPRNGYYLEHMWTILFLES